MKETYPLVVDVFPVNCAKEIMLHDFLSIIGTTTKTENTKKKNILILVVVTNCAIVWNFILFLKDFFFFAA